MNNRNKIIIIILIIIILIIGIGLYFIFNNKSNSSKPKINLLDINNSNLPVEKWSPELCNEYIILCQDRINKGLAPSNAIDDCLEISKLHQC